MTLATLRTMATQILQVDLDMGLTSNGESPRKAEYNAVINQALRFISRRLVLLSHKVALTLTAGTLSYNLEDVTTPIVGQRVIQPFSVTLNGSPLQDRWSRAYGLWGIHELERQYPGYLTAANGTPVAAAWLGRNGGANLVFNCPPSSAVVSGGSNYVSGLVIAADLASDSDVPGIPTDCHEAVAALAAVYAAIPAATEAEAWQRVQALGKFHEPVEYVREVNLQAARTMSGSNNPWPLLIEAEPQMQGE